LPQGKPEYQAILNLFDGLRKFPKEKVKGKLYEKNAEHITVAFRGNSEFFGAGWRKRGSNSESGGYHSSDPNP